MTNFIDSKNYMIHRAIEVAAIAHMTACRKGSQTPYIVHPFEVALILQENNASEELIAAGILHDVLEDSDITEEELKLEFGQVVSDLVIGASEVLEDRENTSWEERKRHTIEYLLNAPIEVKMVSCADKLSNIRSMIKDDKTHGGKLWERFNAGFEDQKWYYTELVKSLADLKDYDMYIEFKRNVVELFKSINE